MHARSCVALGAILACTVLHLLDSHRRAGLLPNAVAPRLFLSPIYFRPGQTANRHLGWPPFSASASLAILSPRRAQHSSQHRLLACFLLGIIPPPWMLGGGHGLFSLLCVQLVLEETPFLLLRISQPWSLPASWQADGARYLKPVMEEQEGAGTGLAGVVTLRAAEMVSIRGRRATFSD